MDSAQGTERAPKCFQHHGESNRKLSSTINVPGELGGLITMKSMKSGCHGNQRGAESRSLRLQVFQRAVYFSKKTGVYETLTINFRIPMFDSLS
ncbi:Hypothetical predicted protein [Podarcis lilfordi]|uniref:Uncharacterized protein n=1 Tax=Podarcis lilfordi TaxID=74358 RepID=A0AA35NWD7_9SAUR|nr:Hypothetical predicted protein [Podarcis lilfordi]